MSSSLSQSELAARVTDVLGQLIRIDSRNPDLISTAPGERVIAEHCVAWLREQGVDAWTDEVQPDRCNAVARVGSSGPVLTLCAHLDTVDVAGMTIPPFEPAITDGRMYGRGAYDMKGGAAAILVAMAELARMPLRCTVQAALVCDEEYASIGAADFVSRYRSDACIVTEPSEGNLILAHKGFVWLEIETRGVAAHGSRWQDGVSAVGRMGAVIGALERHDAEVLRARTHPLLGPASMHCAMVSGGDGWSTYAPRCALRVERRTLPGETSAQVLAEVRELIAATGVEAEVREVLSRSPLECAQDSAIAGAVRDAATSVTGTQPEDAGVAYWMDAAIFADAGAETVNYGPGGTGAHAAVEWVELDSVVRCTRVLVEAAQRFA